jgi:hypothetical protein
LARANLKFYTLALVQFRDKVLPMFATRNVDDRMTCVPNQLSGSGINLKFEAFAGVPVAK